MTLLTKRVSRYGGEVLLPILDVWKFRHGRSQSSFLIQETGNAETAFIRFGAGLIEIRRGNLCLLDRGGSAVLLSKFG